MVSGHRLQPLEAEEEKVMPVETPIPADHPLATAWATYRASEEAKNSEKWARYFVVKAESEKGQILISQPHLEGSLWAAFAAGYAAAAEGKDNA